MPVEVVFEVTIPSKEDFYEVRQEILENGGLQDDEIIRRTNPNWPAGMAFMIMSVHGDEVNRNARERGKVQVTITWQVGAPPGTTFGEIEVVLRNAYKNPGGFFALPILSNYKPKLLGIR
jgi:hypothetical protein